MPLLVERRRLWMPRAVTPLRKATRRTRTPCSRPRNGEVQLRGMWKWTGLFEHQKMLCCERRWRRRSTSKAQASKAGDRWRECARRFATRPPRRRHAHIRRYGHGFAGRVRRAGAGGADASSVEEDSLPQKSGSGRCGATRRRPTSTCDAARSRADRALKAVATASTRARPEARRLRCDEALNRASKARRAKTRADDAYARGHHRAAAAMYRDALRLDAFSEVAGLRAAVHCNVAACALVLDRCGRAVGRVHEIVEARLRRC